MRRKVGCGRRVINLEKVSVMQSQKDITYMIDVNCTKEHVYSFLSSIYLFMSPGIISVLLLLSHFGRVRPHRQQPTRLRCP